MDPERRMWGINSIRLIGAPRLRKNLDPSGISAQLAYVIDIYSAHPRNSLNRHTMSLYLINMERNPDIPSREGLVSGLNPIPSHTAKAAHVSQTSSKCLDAICPFTGLLKKPACQIRNVYPGK